MENPGYFPIKQETNSSELSTGLSLISMYLMKPTISVYKNPQKKLRSEIEI